MGAGGSRKDAGKLSGVMRADGIIGEDRLSGHIYIQAKRWSGDRTPGNPGRALMGKGAKGIFITTFVYQGSCRIRSYNRNHIILIDGEQMANLMMDLA